MVQSAINGEKLPKNYKNTYLDTFQDFESLICLINSVEYICSIVVFGNGAI